MAPVVCTCFVLIVVFATIAYFKASSRRMQDVSCLDMDDGTMGQRKAESLSMNTLRMKGVPGHAIVCVAGDEAADMILTPEPDGACYDGKTAADRFNQRLTT